MDKEERRREYEENMKKIDPMVRRQIYSGIIFAILCPIMGVFLIIYNVSTQINEPKSIALGVVSIIAGIGSIFGAKYYYKSRVDAIKEKEKENKEDSIKEGETQQ